MENITNELTNKKQHREQEQINWKKQEKRNKQKEIARRVGVWSAVVLSLVLMVLGLAKLGANSGVTTGGTLADAVTASDWIRGNINAKVTLVEYSDFQCPACAAAEPTLEMLLKEFGDKIQLIYRHYPLMGHPYSQNAARAAEAAGKQGKFWEMHDLLFKNQTIWSNSNNIDETFIFYAQTLNLDKDKFISDSKSTETQKNIDEDFASGNRSNINGTPTFFLNGQKLLLQNFNDLKTTIGDAVKNTN
jgi:protein-disulfide isomerase